jgi:aerobic carbon-monoxide dehydrogenase medium subunit
MYPSRFRYEAPSTIEAAIALLTTNDDAKVIAGGQSLLPMMKLRFASPELLVDINNIPGLGYHRRDADGSIHIGALCRHAELERSQLLRDHQPTLAAAAPLVADPIVRTRGTLVGSLCHADPQGDWASCMVALDGSIVAQGPNGRRVIPVRSFVTGPFQTVLAPDEIAIEAVVPAPRGVQAGGYLKLERRVGDFATAGVAIALQTDRAGGAVTSAGIGLTGVGGSTINAAEAAQSLVGSALTTQSIARAGELAAAASQPRTDHRGSAAYKRHIVRTFVVRILTSVADSAEKAA